ncbi:MAG: endonuclease [Bacteriovoracaceae bacterium]|nr:endonuclease [Bacteriovoracaceae bacterium]
MKNLNMRGILILGLNLCLCSSVWASLDEHPYYAKYLASFQKEKDEKLKTLLGDAIANNVVFSYKEARTYLFGDIYLENKNGQNVVTDTYCEENFTAKDGVGTGKIPNHQEINCEHTWPQSRFSSRQSKGAQKSDLHHLFPVKAVANSARGNIPFGEVNGEKVSGCEASLRGDDIYGNTAAFEPPKAHKGNVARAIFYFAVRYKMNVPAEEEVHLRLWHRLDPIDSDEIRRHERIYELQGNRNPFIDDPDLVDKLSDI